MPHLTRGVQQVGPLPIADGFLHLAMGISAARKKRKRYAWRIGSHGDENTLAAKYAAATAVSKELLPVISVVVTAVSLPP